MPDTTETLTSPALAVLDRELERLTRRVVAASVDVSNATAKVRGELDAVDHAIANDLRVRGSVSGESFFASNARDLARAIEARQAVYDDLTRLGALRDAVYVRAVADAETTPEGVQLARGELGEALMKDGDAKDAAIQRALELLATVRVGS